MSQPNDRSTHSDLAGVTHWLIHHAAHRAPDSLSSRLEEEWLADLECRSSSLSRLRFAAGCCWATVLIARECSGSRVPAASSPVSAGGFVTLTDRNFGYFSLRSASCRAVLRINHDTRAHTRDHTSVNPGEPSAQGYSPRKGICHADSNEGLDDHRAEGGCRGSPGARSKRRSDVEDRRDRVRAVYTAPFASYADSRGRTGCGGTGCRLSGYG
jgi:hypothetical protein